MVLAVNKPFMQHVLNVIFYATRVGFRGRSFVVGSDNFTNFLDSEFFHVHCISSQVIRFTVSRITGYDRAMYRYAWHHLSVELLNSVILPKNTFSTSIMNEI